MNKEKKEKGRRRRRRGSVELRKSRHQGGDYLWRGYERAARRAGVETRSQQARWRVSYREGDQGAIIPRRVPCSIRSNAVSNSSKCRARTTYRSVSGLFCANRPALHHEVMGIISTCFADMEHCSLSRISTLSRCVVP